MPGTKHRQIGRASLMCEIYNPLYYLQPILYSLPILYPSQLGRISIFKIDDATDHSAALIRTLTYSTPLFIINITDIDLLMLNLCLEPNWLWDRQS